VARDGLAALALAAVLAAAGAAPGLAAEEAILPLDAHTVPDARALAGEYAGELRALNAGLARCAPELDVPRHGIGFRRPRGSAGGPPYLTLWVWLDPERPPRGPTLTSRASAAFGRYGHGLFARLLDRSPVFADSRVGGYSLVLTWLGPTERGGRLVGESLAVFADKLATANFVHDTIGPATFLARAEVRAFDGETELPPPALVLDDGAAPAGLPC